MRWAPILPHSSRRLSWPLLLACLSVISLLHQTGTRQAPVFISPAPMYMQALSRDRRTPHSILCRYAPIHNLATAHPRRTHPSITPHSFPCLYVYIIHRPPHRPIHPPPSSRLPIPTPHTTSPAQQPIPLRALPIMVPWDTGGRISRDAHIDGESADALMGNSSAIKVLIGTREFVAGGAHAVVLALELELTLNTLGTLVKHPRS